MSTRPQKRDYRQRAHSNPYSDHYLQLPSNSNELCHLLYSNDILNEPKNRKISMIDIGCGYGGLLLSLSEKFPNDLILGLEIRLKVQDFVDKRIHHLRNTESKCKNVACLRNNSMKYLPMLAEKSQLTKLFFAFPDPHFKAKNFKRRILNWNLLPEYAFVLKIGGFLYFVTDVKEMFDWVVDTQFPRCPLFKRVQSSEHNDIIEMMYNCTEEGQKVSRNNGSKYSVVYERINFEPNQEYIENNYFN